MTENRALVFVAVVIGWLMLMGSYALYLEYHVAKLGVSCCGSEICAAQHHHSN